MQPHFQCQNHLLCYFVAALARQGLAPSTIRTYLPSVRHAQIVRGLPEPREHSGLPRLRLVQAGLQRARAEQGHSRVRQRLPVTPAHLRQYHLEPSGCRSIYCHAVGRSHCMFLWVFPVRGDHGAIEECIQPKGTPLLG